MSGNARSAARTRAASSLLAVLAAERLEVRASAGSWTFPISRDLPLFATGHLDEGWLFLRARAPGLHGLRAPSLSQEALLQANAKLPGSAKFVLAGSPPCTHLAAEVELPEAQDGERRIAEAIEGLRWGAHLLSGGSMPPPAEVRGASPARAPVPPGSAVAGGAPARLAEVVREAGWPFEERAGGRRAAALEGEPALSADLEALEGGGLLAVVAVSRFRPAELEPSCRAALHHLLLSVSGVVRLARATLVDAAGGESVARLEVRFERPAGPPEVGSALCALSVGAALCVRVARLILQDANCARSYLALRGSPSGAGEASDERKE